MLALPYDATMKMRDSGMPEEAYWETLLDVPLILDQLGVDGTLRDVVELGCGYGTFSLPVARRITGTLTTVDIEPEMVRRTARRAAEKGTSNLRCELRDVMKAGFGVPEASQDAALLFNILHCEQPKALLAEAARVVRPGGSVLVIHWRHDPAAPRGPSLDIRPPPEQIIDWAEQTGSLKAVDGVVDLPPWHYGVKLKRCG
jgi:ubiquinone/menaquinone biosynthesis C-methylase UbiE